MPCLPPGSLPDPGIKLASLMCPALAGRFFTSSSTWEAPLRWQHPLKQNGLRVKRRESWYTKPRAALVPVPAGKVDQVPRTCTAGLRKETKASEYNKDGVERFRHVSTKGRSLTPTLFSILYLYEKREKDKTVDIFSWLSYTSYKKSQEILRAWEWHPVIISYTR